MKALFICDVGKNNSKVIEQRFNEKKYHFHLQVKKRANSDLGRSLISRSNRIIEMS
jgi:hypothetical protein